MQDNGGFSMPSSVGGITDVLAGVLLGHPGNDQSVAFYLVLPGQWGAQLGPVDGGWGVAYGVEDGVGH